MKKSTRLVRIGACALAGAMLFSLSSLAKTTVNALSVPAVTGLPAPTENVWIDCVATTDHNVVVSGTSQGEFTGADNRFYLFELQPYQDNLDGRTDYVASIDKGNQVNYTISLNDGQEDTRLYSKFVTAVYDGEKYIPVSNYAYITNPEVLAPHKDEFRTPLTKKGLLIENSMLADAFELGVKHVIVNIPFHHILGEGIEYTYDGKTYHFNKALMEDYDNTISRMSEKGMLVTAVILNGWNPNTPQLVYPGVKQSATANYYAFNAATKEGYEDIKAIASFLAERYSGADNRYGKVSNWIIGNEINNNQDWNYIGKMGVEQYVKEYERAFRVFYTAIKSVSKNDRLYFSTDYNWNDKDKSQLKYSAKEVVDIFNRNVRSGGNIDWNIAYHPYSIPMTEPEFWDDDQTGLITYDENSPVVNFKNLDVLTDYLQKSEMKTAGGQVRHVILSEQGFTSNSLSRGKNNELQAAAFAYAYYIADSNPYIDAFIMSRQVDAVIEAELSLNFGLWEVDMTSPNVVKPTMRKKIWSTFKAIDTKDSLEATEFAKKVIGIDKWKDVIPNFKRRE